MKCPNCEKLVALKHSEPYKRFYLCDNSNCIIVSIILTTTTKEFKEE